MTGISSFHAKSFVLVLSLVLALNAQGAFAGDRPIRPADVRSGGLAVFQEEAMANEEVMTPLHHLTPPSVTDKKWSVLKLQSLQIAKGPLKSVGWLALLVMVLPTVGGAIHELSHVIAYGLVMPEWSTEIHIFVGSHEVSGLLDFALQSLKQPWILLTHPYNGSATRGVSPELFMPSFVTAIGGGVGVGSLYMLIIYGTTAHFIRWRESLQDRDIRPAGYWRAVMRYIVVVAYAMSSWLSELHYAFTAHFGDWWKATALRLFTEGIITTEEWNLIIADANTIHISEVAQRKALEIQMMDARPWTAIWFPLITLGVPFGVFLIHLSYSKYRHRAEPTFDWLRHVGRQATSWPVLLLLGMPAVFSPFVLLPALRENPWLHSLGTSPWGPSVMALGIALWLAIGFVFENRVAPPRLGPGLEALRFYIYLQRSGA